MVILDGMRLEMMEFPFNPVPYIFFLLHCALICCCTRYICLIEFCFVFSFKIKLLFVCQKKKYFYFFNTSVQFKIVLFYFYSSLFLARYL